jgi:ATP-dependent Zn protease
MMTLSQLKGIYLVRWQKTRSHKVADELIKVISLINRTQNEVKRLCDQNAVLKRQLAEALKSKENP